MVTIAIAGVLFSISLRAGGTAYILGIRHHQHLQAGLLAQSGIARTEYFLNGGDGHDMYWETERFEETIDRYGTIALSCTRFGAFSRIVSTGTHRSRTCTIDGIMGRDIPGNLAPLVTLSGHIGGIVLAQGSRINGKAVVNHGTAYAENNTTPLPGAHTWLTQRQSPPLPFSVDRLADFMNTAARRRSDAAARTDILCGQYNITSDNDSLIRDNSLIINGSCTVHDITLENITAIITGTLTLGANTYCKRSLFICDTLVVNSGNTRQCVFFSNGTQRLAGGDHASQFFSNDSIIVSYTPQTSNGYSLWVSHRIQKKDSTVSGAIVISANTTVYGHAICFTDSLKNSPHVIPGPAIHLGEKSVFHGTIITDGDCSMKRITIYGHLWARSVVAKEDGTSYKNFFFGCISKPLATSAPFPLLGPLPASVRLIENG